MKSPSCADSIYPDSYASHSQTIKVIHSKLIPERRLHCNTAETKSTFRLPINTYSYWIGMTDCSWSVNLQFPICLFSIVGWSLQWKDWCVKFICKIVMAYVHSTSCSLQQLFIKLLRLFWSQGRNLCFIVALQCRAEKCVCCHNYKNVESVIIKTNVYLVWNRI